MDEDKRCCCSLLRTSNNIVILGPRRDTRANNNNNKTYNTLDDSKANGHTDGQRTRERATHTQFVEWNYIYAVDVMRYGLRNSVRTCCIPNNVFCIRFNEWDEHKKWEKMRHTTEVETSNDVNWQTIYICSLWMKDELVLCAVVSAFRKSFQQSSQGNCDLFSVANEITFSPEAFTTWWS